MQLLHIDSAITGDQSTSRQLTADIVRAWQAQHPDTQVQYLDLLYGVGKALASDGQWPNWYDGNAFKAARDAMMQAPATP